MVQALTTGTYGKHSTELVQVGALQIGKTGAILTAAELALINSLSGLSAAQITALATISAVQLDVLSTAVEVVTGTNVLTAAESGTTFVLNSADAFVTTLPEVAAGLNFKFYAGVTQVTGGDHTVIAHANDQATIFGQCVVAGVVILATVEDTIIFEEDTMLPGDYVDLFCDGVNWYVNGMAQVSLGIAFAT